MQMCFILSQKVRFGDGWSGPLKGLWHLHSHDQVSSEV